MSKNLKSNKVRVIKDVVAKELTDAWFRQVVKCASKIARKPARVVQIILVGDKKMRMLNTVYRQKNKTTDVLSFPASEKATRAFPIPVSGNKDFLYLGEIVVNIPQVKRQAKEYGVSFKIELARMAIHGFLHVWGYDHVKKSDASKMMPLQEKILKGIIKKRLAE